MAELGPAIHGGNVYAASRGLRRPISGVLDFSASINPLGPSPKAIKAAIQGLSALSHYPDPECWEIRRGLALRWKLSPEHFVIGNGSTELIDLLPRALTIRRALILGPTFSEYARAMARAKGRSTNLLATRRDGYRPPLDKAIELVQVSRRGRQPIDALVLCHPNSPTGQVCEAADLVKLVRSADRLGIWTILDETFAEYCQDRSMLSRCARYGRLIVLRSFTKFYALPGLRIGYMVASKETSRRVLAVQPPWSVNALAQQAAAAALSDRGHARRSLVYTQKERERFITRLRLIPGLRVFPSHANFLLLELPQSYRASQLTNVLARQGLLIRDCSSVPGLNEHTIRVAVRTSKENDLLSAALNTQLSKGR